MSMIMPGQSAIAIRPARVEETAALTALVRRSKAHWGYDAAFMARCTLSLSIREEAIAAGRVLVASRSGASADRLGVAELAPVVDGVIDLDKLFVDPPAIGTGVGALLLAHAVRMARERQARRMTILADPHAAPFYEKMGARFLHMAPSDAVPGRELPLYELDLDRPFRAGGAPQQTTTPLHG